MNGQDAANGQPIPETVNSDFLSAASAITTPDNSADTGVRLQYRTSATNFMNLPGANAEFPTLEGRVTAAAADPAKYFTFSLTASAAFELTLLSFDMAEGSTNVNDTRGAQIRMSLDDFTTSDIDLGTRSVTDPASQSDVYEHFSVNLLDTAVTAGQTVTFRFLPFVSTGAAGGVRFDNITISEGVMAAVPGDYSGNGTVDAADYVVWRDTLGQSGPADGTGPGGTPDGVVDELDYVFWRERFGNTSGTASVGGNLAAPVPEASTMLLALIGLSCLGTRARIC